MLRLENQLRNTKLDIRRGRSHPHLRQLWDLNQPFEILQVTGAIEETL